jgi:C4-dicarboxylate transporter DctM subunit
MLLVACASVYSLVLTTEGIAEGVARGLLDLTSNRYALLLIIHVILLLAGCFIDAISIFYIFLPMFLPVAHAAGINPIHFGILMTVNLAIGQVTPPIGVNLFTVSGVTGVPVKEVITGIWPLIGAELLALAVITFVPQLSLALV